MYGYMIPQGLNNPNVTLSNIDKQIESQENRVNELKQMRNQLAQTNQFPAINQTFQLAPNNQSGIKYANTIDDVAKEMVYIETPFFSKDMSVLWIKSPNNQIKAYSLTEIIQKDEKDMEIEYLRAQVEELKKGKEKDEECSSNNDTEPVKKQKSSSISNSSESK